MKKYMFRSFSGLVYLCGLVFFASSTMALPSSAVINCNGIGIDKIFIKDATGNYNVTTAMSGKSYADSNGISWTLGTVPGTGGKIHMAYSTISYGSTVSPTTITCNFKVGSNANRLTMKATNAKVNYYCTAGANNWVKTCTLKPY